MLFQESQGKPLQFGVTAACGAGFLLFGYDQGVFGGLLDNEPFLKTFGYPGATIQGQIVATYDIGCIIGTLVSMFFGDRLGRRRCILVGCCILIVGAVLQTASYSLAQMIVGRVVAGVGNGMNTVAIPVWQSETLRDMISGALARGEPKDSPQVKEWLEELYAMSTDPHCRALPDLPSRG